MKSLWTLASFTYISLFSFAALSAEVAASKEIKVQTENAVPTRSFSIGIGSDVVLETSDTQISGPAIFLGNAVTPNGENLYRIYFNKKSAKIFFVSAQRFAKSSQRLQTIMDPYEQAGGTCTGYAIFDFLYQTSLSGFEGTGALSARFANEEKRTTLLVDNINNYYLTSQHRYSIPGILNSYGKDMGFKCDRFKTDTYSKAKDKVLEMLKAGWPVIISFNLGPKMYEVPFRLEKADGEKAEMDQRVWIPRKIGERNRGGHTIVAAGSFEWDNKTYLVTIDSDWSEPRIWDMDSFLNQKTALDEVEFVTCKEKQL